MLLFQLTGEDRWTLFALATGQALKNTFAALFSGGTLFPWDVRREGTAGLANWLVEERITIFNSSASLFREFVETLTGQERFPDLRLIRTGSEKMVPSDVESYRRYFPSTCLLANMYSTNETGAVCCSLIDQETARLLNEAHERATRILLDDQELLRKLAKVLMEREVIDGEEMRRIIEETSPGPWIVPGTSTSRKRHHPVVEAPEPREANPAEGSV